MHYYVITYHMITGMNNDECHVLEKAVNISKRLVRIWRAIVQAGHHMHYCVTMYNLEQNRPEQKRTSTIDAYHGHGCWKEWLH